MRARSSGWQLARPLSSRVVDLRELTIVRCKDSGGRPFGVHNLIVIGCAGLVTICHRHRIDCLLAIGLVLLAAAVTEQSLLSGSKALTVEHYGLVPMYKTENTIRICGFVPR